MTETTMSSKNTRLRDFTDDDLPALFSGLSNPRIVAHYGISYDNVEECREFQMNWIKSIHLDGTGRWFVIENIKTFDFMGAIGIYHLDKVNHCAELGYWLFPEFWGNRYMTEALESFLSYIYSHTELNRLVAFVEEENERSKQLLSSTGFILEGVKRECEFKGNCYLSLLQYSLLQSDRNRS